MPEKTQYTPGTPSWVDLTSPDIAASAAFYGSLFGWEAEDQGPEAGGYTMFKRNGKNVAGVGPRPAPEAPVAWSCYISVDDVDKTIEIAQTNGAGVLMPAMDVLDVGRMAVLADPTGAAISLWQPGTHTGAEVVDEPNTLTWIELSTRDTAAAERFYTSVFDWTARTTPMGDQGSYTEFKLGDTSVAGLMEMPPTVPPTVPSYWMPYFMVGDVDAAVAQIGALGGRVLVPPMDVPSLRFAIATDPHGATFGVLKFAEKS